MFIALRHRVFRRLFAAHVVALLGTGLSTIAIGFLVFDISGTGAAAVLGTLLAIKMSTYLVIGPLAPAIARRVGAKRLMVITDIGRAGVAIALPFVDNVPVAYLLIFVLQAASALFTPTFQATIPRVVTDQKQYTGALALSRLAYDLEPLASPTVASLILLIAPSTARGARLMTSVPSLRGILTLHLALASVGAIAMVLTVPLVRGELGGSESQAAALLAFYGIGSITSAALMPTILSRIQPRPYMLTGLLVMASAMLFVWPVLAIAPGQAALPWLFAIWFVAGLGNSAVLAPMGRVIRDSVGNDDLPHVFAAQFSLSHGWWLLSYPIAGWGATVIGFGPITLLLAVCGGLALALATYFWRIPAPPGASTGASSGTMGAREEERHG